MSDMADQAMEQPIAKRYSVTGPFYPQFASDPSPQAFKIRVRGRDIGVLITSESNGPVAVRDAECLAQTITQHLNRYGAVDHEGLPLGQGWLSTLELFFADGHKDVHHGTQEECETIQRFNSRPDAPNPRPIRTKLTPKTHKRYV